MKEVLGEGTFGKVLKAYDTASGNKVAIKVFKRSVESLRDAKSELKIHEALKELKASELKSSTHYVDSEWVQICSIQFT